MNKREQHAAIKGVRLMGRREGKKKIAKDNVDSNIGNCLHFMTFYLFGSQDFLGYSTPKMRVYLSVI